LKVSRLTFLEGSSLGIIRQVVEPIVGPEGLVWKWFPNSRRSDNAGKPKYEGFLLYERNLGTTRERCKVLFKDGNEVSRLPIVKAKVLAVNSEIPTSLLVRNLSRTPPLYGGASFGSDWVHAGSGLPELLDHLIICRWQLHMELITASSYDVRTGFDYSGISILLDDASITTGGYMDMKSKIDQLFIAASAKFR
jgi:hypothetical protein